jgi:putative sigma-54 modulation protein
MKIYIRYIDIDSDERLNEFIQKKVDKLETFYDRIVEGEIFLKRSNNNTEENAVAELRINVPGNSLFAKEQGKSFEAAIDGCVEAVRKQLKKVKGKQAAQ